GDGIAVDTLGLLPGQLGGYAQQIICVLVMVSALGAVNGLIFTSSRIYATMGSDYRLFSGLAHRVGGSPIWSLLLSMIISVSMVCMFGTTAGRELLNQFFEAVGVGKIGYFS